MDKLAIRKMLYAGMGNDARSRRLADLKKKYSTLSPEMGADMMKQDEAIDAAGLPEPKNDPDKKMEGVEVVMSGMKDIGNDAAKGNDDYAKQMAELDDDEEMKKWMAKQKG